MHREAIPRDKRTKQKSKLFINFSSCKIPACDTEPAEYTPNWLIHAVPYNNDLPEKCFSYMNTVENSTQCYDIDLFNMTEKISCDEFVYETDEVTLLNEVSKNNDIFFSINTF